MAAPRFTNWSKTFSRSEPQSVRPPNHAGRSRASFSFAITSFTIPTSARNSNRQPQHYDNSRYHGVNPDDKASDPWPERFLEALETVRLSGRTNMLDHPEVTRLIAEMGYPEVAEWLADHRREYAAFVLEGTRPLGKNFGGKEDPAPCADK